MARTYYTVERARKALDEAERALVRNKQELARLTRMPPDRRNAWAIEVQKSLVEKLAQRRRFMEEQLRRAQENDALGIPPDGPRVV